MRPQRTKQKPIPKRTLERNEFGFPPMVYIRGTLCYFQGLALITRDGLYRGTNEKGEVRNGLVCHPEAHDNQQRWLNRGS